ncbi:hypothetical protein [Derxia lacustris]|uniref:hypothetical protein n=1 Tax=Derxia lacustris TaxID=764842 RepID=UPI001593E72B|nr:hypothetical protein [Derxia lacustris]
MIYVVEEPKQGDVKAWFAFDLPDFIRKVYALGGREPWEIYDVTSARELLDLFDKTPETPGVKDDCPAVYALGEAHGWDTPLYRADALLGEGVYQPEPIEEKDACAAAVAIRVDGLCHVLWSDKEAIAAMENDPDFDKYTHFYARFALREQMVSVEALDENGPI